FSSRRRHTRFSRDWSSDVCSSDLFAPRLDIVHLEAVALQVAERHADMVEFAAGENVGGDGAVLRVLLAEDLVVLLGRTGDGMVELGRASCRERVQLRELAVVGNEH